ncbi:MAG TPA: class I SAM-dependent methyltransferase [Acidobacteriaceae bacterium]|nr:class I SAM-dependent methyltransferase [Acidobacteriaceae bacterium]
MMNLMQHDAEILDQFTRQAEPFLRRHENSHDDLLQLMVECADVQREDSVLDIACGPGIVSCFFARHASHVTGLDIVPAMLERAKRLQIERELTNIDWALGESTALPFAGDSFDRVVTRFSFHHYMKPQAAIAEMRRVCRPGGIVLIADVAPRPEAQRRFNEWEILRDPSHTRALTESEMEALGEDAGLQLIRQENFRMQMNLEDLLGSSFPKPGDADKIRALFEEDIQRETDTLGVSASRDNGAVKLTYPIAIFAWRKPA